MKKLFTILAVAAACVACQKNEIVSLDKGEAIAFGNAFVENSVRAAQDPSYTPDGDKGVKQFALYGTVNGGQGAVVIYPGATVTKGDAAYGAAWSCKDANGNEIKQYWVPGASYKFVGIVDGNKSGVTETTIVDGMPTTISYKADGATDLLCQTIEKTAKTDGTQNGLVQFTFSHLLAKAKFTVVNESTEATNYLHKVRNIKIANAYNTAVYNVATANWESAESTNGQAFDTIVASAASTECDNEKLLIPGLKSVTVEFVVDLYYVEGEKETLVSSTEYTTAKNTAKVVTLDIEAGNAYNFQLKVKVGELIQFTATKMTDWVNSNPYPTPLQ